ncbi:MAG: alpha/beta hydrolase [Gammaproteobacteria bacterium]|nr:alpha/beta hydrolase [Gammaproteobacteria bacterium]
MTTAENSGLGNLTSFFARKRGVLLNRVLPGWTNTKIDAQLFMPATRTSKTFRLPRGFDQSDLKTDDGTVRVYRTGKGPCVVFVHGWGGNAVQFFPLMRGLSQIGFSAMAFDHLGHGQSERKPGTPQQCIATTNFVLNRIRKNGGDGLAAVVGHSTGCVSIANARPALLKDTPLFLISPVFNYKLFFLKRLVKLGLDNELVKQYASRFTAIYRNEYQKLELARHLARYGDYTVVAHDETDSESAVLDSAKFCARYPLTRLLVTKQYDHVRLINSESVWQELKSHLNYDDTTINYTADVVYDTADIVYE